VPYAMASAMRDVKFRITPEHVYQHDPARAKRLLSEAGTPTASRWSCTPTSFPVTRGANDMRGGAGGVLAQDRRADDARFPSTTSRSARSGSTGQRRARSATTTSRTGTGSARFAMIDKWTNPTAKTAAIRDAELDKLVGAGPRRDRPREGQRPDAARSFQRLRSEHLGIPLVYLHSAYATSKKITRWNPGAVMYDLNIDELIRQR